MLQKFVPVVSLALLFGCGDKDLQQYSLPKDTKGQASGHQHEKGHVHRPFDYDLPANWTDRPSSGMRFGSFYAAGESIDGSLVYLGPEAGDPVSNINRWRGQAGLENLSPEGVMSSLKSLEAPLGTFQWVMLENPGEGNSIMGAMLKLKKGVLFVKLTGPAEALKKEQDGFEKLCMSLRPHTP